MRLGANRDVDERDGRADHRRHYDSDPRDWYEYDPEDHDDVPYPMPHAPHLEDIQRPLDWTPRRHARSLDASHPAMLTPPRMARYSSDAAAYRRPRDVVVTRTAKDEPPDRWRTPRRRPVPQEYEYRLPRPRPRRIPSPIVDSSSEDDDHDEDEDHGSTSTSSSEEEEQEEEDDDDEEHRIEVVEEIHDDVDLRHHHRQHRRQHQYHHDHHAAPRHHHHDSSEEGPHIPEHQRRRSSSSSHDDEIEVYQYQEDSFSERSLPPLRPSLRRRTSDPPRHIRPQKAISLIETSRPPVSSRRATKIYEEREIYREGRPRRSATLASPRRTRSYSRRPPSIIESIFGSSGHTSPANPPKLVLCISCLGETPSHKCPKLKCGHSMCSTCLVRQFKLSINDPKLMPPKCCTTDYIPLRHVDKLLKRSFKKKWNRKHAEYSTRNRIYCPNQECGEWIKPEYFHRDRSTGRRMACCRHCRVRVCAKCNQEWHGNRRCVRDEETEEFLEHAKQQGWQRCYKCRSVVELKEGCNHMTCRCGGEFCMICGAKWKSCDCLLFSDESDMLEDMNIPLSVEEDEEDSVFLRDRSPLEDGYARSKKKLEQKRIRYLNAQHEQALSRRQPAAYAKEDYDVVDGARGMIANEADQIVGDHYRRKLVVQPPPPLPAAPPGPPQPGEYERPARRASMERLKDRFSEKRQVPPPAPMPAPPDPYLPMNAPHHHGNIMMPRPPMGMQLMGPSMGGPMGPPPPDGMYQGAGPLQGQERVIVESDPTRYEEQESHHNHSPRGKKSRRRQRDRGRERERERESEQENDPTPSSTLAGLTGRERGVSRIDGWMKFVVPENGIGEPTAVNA